MGARAAGGCLSALDPEVAMFQDEPVCAEAQQRRFGQVLGAAIGQPGLSAPGHSSLIAVAIRPSIFLVSQRTSGRPTAVSGNLLQLEGDGSAELGQWPSERCGRRCWKAPA